jgi:hypothetical protein
LGEVNLATTAEIEAVLAGIKSLDDNATTLRRTVAHLESNGVDLAKTPLALGPHLRFDNQTEQFTNSDSANEMLTREYRAGFEVPSGDNV